MLQVLTIRNAPDAPTTDQEWEVMLFQRGRESKSPLARAHHLSSALQKLAALPPVTAPSPSGSWPLILSQISVTGQKTKAHICLACCVVSLSIEQLVCRHV